MISSLMAAGRGRLGGRTSARARPSWARASLTTLTLSAEESARRSSSNLRTVSQTFMAAPKSSARSASNMASARPGATFARPEVNPRAPTAQKAGAVSSAAPASQVSRSIPASRATAANLVASRTAYLTPMTFGARSASSAMCAPVRRSSLMYRTTPRSGTAFAMATW